MIRLSRGVLLLPAVFVCACASGIHWSPGPPGPPVCLPDRPLAWDDFPVKSFASVVHALPAHATVPSGPIIVPSAQTTVRFGVRPEARRLFAEMDHAESWIRGDVAGTWHRWPWSGAHQLLRHEQVHFAISCLLTRQANSALGPEDDPFAMLQLLKAVATRVNLQYDSETSHGRNRLKQTEWEDAVESRLAAGLLQ